MRRHLLSVALAVPVLIAATASHAQRLRPLCAAAEKPVRADARLRNAVHAAFGAVAFTAAGERCLYPLQLLHYPCADVLLTQGNVPGDACHGCAASLSAYVFRRPGGLALVKALPDFATAGSAGAAGDITPVAIGADDGLAIEGGGTFQGYSGRSLDLYVFRAGRVVHLEADPPIRVAASNAGAMTDDSKIVEVGGAWSLQARGANLVVTYTVKAAARMRIDRVVWEVQGTRLVRTSGRVPPELEQASGGG